ncbi:unnamed protein product [Rangifer tarandus platyrhynchus]|uniref:Uncharacterized protein n=1 Tax=Rangifer tarandus platyrhynchus TaxID=3082113 RepID=A0ABN8Z314_RANTA|nr:unnamed protein product [Rangifer tarandus platyrhynchus]
MWLTAVRGKDWPPPQPALQPHSGSEEEPQEDQTLLHRDAGTLGRLPGGRGWREGQEEALAQRGMVPLEDPEWPVVRPPFGEI